MDSSPDMLRQARERLPELRVRAGRSRQLEPARSAPTCCSPTRCFNGCPTIPRCCGGFSQALPEGGVLAVQMPDNTGRAGACAHARGGGRAGRGPRSSRRAAAARDDLPTPGGLLRSAASPSVRHLDIWHTVYNHVMAGPEAIVEWFKGSALRPFLAAARRRHAPRFRRRLYRAHRQGLSGALRRQGAVAVSAPVHRGDAIVGAHGVGWVERSETHHLSHTRSADGFASLYPSYDPTLRSFRLHPHLGGDRAGVADVLVIVHLVAALELVEIAATARRCDGSRAGRPPWS